MARAPKKELQSLAERLRRVAVSLGTQSATATAAGVSLTQMQNYIAAKSRPAPHVLARLAVVTGFALEWLETGEGPSQSALARNANPSPSDVMNALASSPSAMRRAYPVVSVDESSAPSHRHQSQPTALGSTQPPDRERRVLDSVSCVFGWGLALARGVSEATELSDAAQQAAIAAGFELLFQLPESHRTPAIAQSLGAGIALSVKSLAELACSNSITALIDVDPDDRLSDDAHHFHTLAFASKLLGVASVEATALERASHLTTIAMQTKSDEVLTDVVNAFAPNGAPPGALERLKGMLRESKGSRPPRRKDTAKTTKKRRG